MPAHPWYRSNAVEVLVFLRMLYDEKLAQASYVVACQATGDALVIDPNRDLDQYIDLVTNEEFTITAITETHIHADFASGARELAARTGAKLYLSDEGDADWKYQFADQSGATLVHDGDTFSVGNIKLEVLHTPGHTPEHISFLLTDTAAADTPMGIFTGDFVFVGDVGRPDLLEVAAGFKGTMESGARQLYASIQRFKQLPDYIQVWPGHGAGSACGKALGAVPQSTVGYEKLFNWAMNVDTEAEFVKQVTSDQPEPPVYFKEMKRINKEGVPLLTDATQPARLASSVFDQNLSSGMKIVDTRSVEAYAQGHIPGTINIPLGKQFITWAGWLLPFDAPFALIVDEPNLDQAVLDLRLIGLDGTAGYWTPDVITDREEELAQVELVDADTTADLVEQGKVNVLDVRGLSEYKEGHVPGAVHIPLGYLEDRIDEVPYDKPLIVHCLSGFRSTIAASILHAHGRMEIQNLTGGYESWASAGKPIERSAREYEAVAT
jgi:hydroxyacylglutathione hydrolase